MIRPAVHGDLEALILLGWEMHQESRFSVLDYSPEKVADLLVTAMHNDDFLLMVVEKGGDVVGGIMAYCMEHWCSHDRVASDFAVFLHPDYRGSSASAQLIMAYRRWAEANNAKLIDLGVTTGVLVEQTQKLYEALGWSYVGPLMEIRGAP